MDRYFCAWPALVVATSAAPARGSGPPCTKIFPGIGVPLLQSEPGHPPDTFTRLLAGTLSITFFFYVFVNSAMVTGLLPVVGVPLPLVSAGGTSMVTLLAGFGILMSIQTHRKFGDAVRR